MRAGLWQVGYLCRGPVEFSMWMPGPWLSAMSQRRRSRRGVRGVPYSPLIVLACPWCLQVGVYARHQSYYDSVVQYSLTATLLTVCCAHNTPSMHCHAQTKG